LKVLKLTVLAVALAAIAPGAAMATPTAAPPNFTTAYTSTDNATEAVIGLGESSGITITISEPVTGSTAGGVGFTDTLPAGVVLDNPVSATFSGCGTPLDDPSATGTLDITAVAGQSTITVSGAVVKAGTNCVLTFAVLGNAANSPTTDADVYTPAGDLGGFEFATTSTGAPSPGAGTVTPATLDVLPPPTAIVTSPVNKAVYKYGQVVDASYACAQPDYNTQWDEVGIETAGIQIGGCFGTDDLFNTVDATQPIDTTIPGAHSLDVSAISFDGDETDTIVNYTVLPDNVFTLGKLGPLSGSKFPVVAKLPGKGTLVVTLFKGTTKVATGTLTVSRAGKATDHLTLTKAGKALKGHPKLKLVASFKPKGGTTYTVDESKISL
jgi:hypothetical protein